MVEDIQRASVSCFKYTTLTGFFVQDQLQTNGKVLNQTAANFGLTDRDCDGEDERDITGKTQWQRFNHYVDSLNSKRSRHERFKVLFMARHGQGHHDVAEARYGTQAWDDHWASLDGDSTARWADAHLTSTGIAQAEAAGRLWDSQMKDELTPAPQIFYCSSLHRCFSTANLTFSSALSSTLSKPFSPIVKELLREVNGVHTCDRRSNKTYIHKEFPDYKIEESLTEEDELWRPDHRETDSEVDLRMMDLMDDIFTHDTNTWISLTSHGDAIGGILRVLGHQPFLLQTGGSISVLVKAEIVNSGDI